VTVKVAGGKEWIRAPRGNNESVFAPDRREIPALIELNRQRLSHAGVAGWIGEVRREARAEVLRAATGYLAGYAEPYFASFPTLSCNKPWIVGGHQPEFFHPGVWFKNFLLDAVAQETGGLGLHAIVDHDTARATSIKVPSMDLNLRRIHGRLIPLPIARPSSAPLPWNALRLDVPAIATTLREIESSLRSVGIEQSMAGHFFGDLAAMSPEVDVATAFSRARHAMELRHGLRNLEVPVSHIGSTHAWHAFVQHCIVNAESLHAIYNQSLHEYREREQIHNPAQPVPRLGQREGWIELPFWLQLPDDATRHRLWVKRSSGDWIAAPSPDAMETPCKALPLIGTSGAASLRDALFREGIHIAPRALMTTLFLRTFVADVFVHGIGGGLYDRLTDMLMERFLGLEPPAYVTCTATLWLNMAPSHGESLDAWGMGYQQLRREGQLLRSWPEASLDPSDEAAIALLEQHRAMLARIPPRGQKKGWHEQMVRLKAQIAQAIAPVRRRWEMRMASYEAQAAEWKAIQSREYPFLLFPESEVMARLQELAA